MARKKNAAEIKEPDEYRGLVRLAMLDFRGRHQPSLMTLRSSGKVHRNGSDESFCEADSQVRPPGYLLLAKRPQVRGDARNATSHLQVYG